MLMQCAEILKPVFTAKQPIIVLYGGRNSTKSNFLADFFTSKMHAEGCDVLGLRERMNRIEDSVHKIMTHSVKRFGFEGWTINKNHLISPSGGKTSYVGARTSVRSAEGFKYSWYEEAQQATQESLDELLPTIIRTKGAQCFFSMNPASESDPASKEFIVPFKTELDRHGFYEDDMHLIIKVNWRDNPFFDENANKLRQKAKRTMSEARYRWVWEGDFYDEVDFSIISTEVFNACIDAHKKLGFEPTGPIVTTYDPADSNDDRACAVFHGNVLLDCRTEDKLDINDSTDWACNIAREAKSDFFIYDGDGCGIGLRRQISDFFKSQKVSIIEFKGGRTCKNPDNAFEHKESKCHSFDYENRVIKNKDAFFNLRSHNYFDLADAMRKTYEAVVKGQALKYSKHELFSISSDCLDINKLRTELCRIPQKHTTSGIFQVEPKKDMLKIYKIPSPNLADCIMMRFVEISNSKTKINKVSPGFKFA